MHQKVQRALGGNTFWYSHWLCMPKAVSGHGSSLLDQGKWEKEVVGSHPSMWTAFIASCQKIKALCKQTFKRKLQQSCHFLTSFIIQQHHRERESKLATKQAWSFFMGYRQNSTATWTKIIRISCWGCQISESAKLRSGNCQLCQAPGMKCSAMLIDNISTQHNASSSFAWKHNCPDVSSLRRGFASHKNIKIEE